MTFASVLADRIIALINSKPSSPTKAEIERILEGETNPLLAERIRKPNAKEMAWADKEWKRLADISHRQHRDSCKDLTEKRAADIFNAPSIFWSCLTKDIE